MKKLIFLIVMAALPAVTLAGPATLRWTPPTTCVDLSALTNCPTTGFEVQVAEVAAGPFTSVVTTAPSVSTYTIQNLPPGPRFFRVLTVSNDMKSAPSAVVNKTISGVEPNPPSAVTAE